MILALALAALSLPASAGLDVPYVPQTPRLCGGAAVAMVLRYWGDTHANVQQFASLVDRTNGGIPDDVLVNAVAARGWSAIVFEGSIETIGERVAAGQPIIVLLEDRHDRYHYVVVTALRPDAVIVHDPSWGPSRAIRVSEFERRWRAARFWSLLIAPGKRPTRTADPARVLSDDQRVRSIEQCDVLLERAIADVRTRGLGDADAILGEVRAECPTAAGPLRELAGVRFAEHRWKDAAALARDALARAPDDPYALDVLGSSLFLLDDPTGALRAWNRIGKPRLDVVSLRGIEHSRYEAIAEAVRLQPGELLTADDFALAARRLKELPDQTAATLRLRPAADGFATVDATIVERATRPRDSIAWAANGVRAVVDREATVSVPGFTGQGDLWTANWRWWANRPRVGLEFAAPRFAGFPGIWRVDASWQRESFATVDSSAPGVRESRTHGGLSVSDWLTPGLRYTATGGIDVWDSRHSFSTVGFSLERRIARDRVTLGGDAARWVGLGERSGFSSVGARISARAPSPARWGYATGAAFERVSDNAPLTLWPGAGDGHARAALLRAHPLLEDGVVNATNQSAFGRSLVSATAEGQRWLDRPGLVRVGLAAFVDAARAWRKMDGSDAFLTRVDAGIGLRVRFPASERALRLDVAHGVTDRAFAVTLGWF